MRCLHSCTNGALYFLPFPNFDNAGFSHLYNFSAFDIISISSDGVRIYPSSSYYAGVTALDVYYSASYLYDYNNNRLSGFSGFIGKITYDNLVVSSYFDKPSYYNNIARCDEFKLWFSANIQGGGNCSGYILSVGNKVQSGTNTIEGILVPSMDEITGDLVQHDNSLSGNGTVNSPLGVVPGYNETVLFDQSANQNCSTTAEFQMSESLWNFHRAIVEFDNMEYDNTPLNMEIDMDVTNTATTYSTPFRNGTSFPALILPYANFKINEAGNIKYVNRGLLWGNSWTSVNTITGDNKGYRVRKVIGINHK